MQFRFILTLALAVLFIATKAEAQSLFGSSGSSLGTSNTGGQQTGVAGAQGQTTSGINTGQTLGTTNLNSADGSLSATVGQGGFVGGQNNGAFVGNRFAGQTASQGVQPQFNAQQNNNRNTNRNNQGRTDRKAIRPQFRIAFAAPVIPKQELQSRFDLSNVSLPPALSSLRQVQLAVEENGTIKLTGSVATEREKKLIESYVRMEPGVRKVNSELAVVE